MMGLVAPFAGAWIEIFWISSSVFAVLSLPSRERGLKYQVQIQSAPPTQSLPSRERGLKYYSQVSCQQERVSLPSRERGLK